MLATIIVLLLLFWLAGYIHLPLDLSSYAIFPFNGQSITVYNLVVFGLILWVIGILPRPFREIVSVVLLLWVLSVFGIIAISGLSNILVIALVIGLLVYLFK